MMNALDEVMDSRMTWLKSRLIFVYEGIFSQVAIDIFDIYYWPFQDGASV